MDLEVAVSSFVNIDHITLYSPQPFVSLFLELMLCFCGTVYSAHNDKTLKYNDRFTHAALSPHFSTLQD